ncbi:MAG: class I SAM-dependent methyltransferase [Brevinematales bacterium]|nr:class I SAM-dependent methyltransferase [Brevinematales bacterium]
MVWFTLTILFLTIIFLSFYYNLWFVGIIFVILNVSLLWTWKLGAAWDPTPMRVINKVLNYLEPKPTDVIYDLGCGDGRFIIEAVKKYNCKAVGIEIDPIRYLITKIRVKKLGLKDKIKVVWADFFKYPINEATIVFCFLTEEANRKLEIKLSKELSYGTIIVSYIWRFYGFQLLNVIDNEIFFYIV